MIDIPCLWRVLPGDPSQSVMKSSSFEKHCGKNNIPIGNIHVSQAGILKTGFFDHRESFRATVVVKAVP
jgi:hypothetical protein